MNSPSMPSRASVSRTSDAMMLSNLEGQDTSYYRQRIPYDRTHSSATTLLDSAPLLSTAKASKTVISIDATLPATTSAWQTTLWRAGPLFGLLCILFVLLSVPASAIILSASNNKAVDSWAINPNVYLAVITGIGNKALGFAAAQGALITWWVRATKGSTWDMLHYDWAMGSSPFAAIRALREIPPRRVGILAVTSLCGLVIILDGIFLQAATTAILKDLEQPTQLTIQIAPEIPENYTGVYQDIAIDGGDLLAGGIQDGVLPMQNAFLGNDSIPSITPDCPGICRATIKAAAFVAELNNTVTESLNITDAIATETVPEWCTSFLNNTATGNHPVFFGNTTCPLFSVKVDTSGADLPHEAVSLAIGMGDPALAATCSGSWSLRTYTLRPAIREYTVLIFNQTQTMQIEEGPLPGVVAYANNTHLPEILAQNTSITTTFGGLVSIAELRYDTIHDFSIISGRLVYSTPNEFGARMAENGECVYNYEDPTDLILAALNELMFRFSVYAAQNMNETEILSRMDPGLQVTSQVDGTRIDLQPAFQTRWGYFAAAAAIQVICSLLVLVTYWKYWTLGREVSFSPLELAKAFDAPGLRQQPSNHEAGNLAKSVSELRVRYGAVEPEEQDDEDPLRRLIFDEPDRASKPMRSYTLVP